MSPSGTQNRSNPHLNRYIPPHSRYATNPEAKTLAKWNGGRNVEFSNSYKSTNTSPAQTSNKKHPISEELLSKQSELFKAQRKTHEFFSENSIMAANNSKNEVIAIPATVAAENAVVRQTDEYEKAESKYQKSINVFCDYLFEMFDWTLPASTFKTDAIYTEKPKLKTQIIRVEEKIAKLMSIDEKDLSPRQQKILIGLLKLLNHLYAKQFELELLNFLLGNSLYNLEELEQQLVKFIEEKKLTPEQLTLCQRLIQRVKNTPPQEREHIRNLMEKTFDNKRALSKVTLMMRYSTDKTVKKVLQTLKRDCEEADMAKAKYSMELDRFLMALNKQVEMRSGIGWKERKPALTKFEQENFYLWPEVRRLEKIIWANRFKLNLDEVRELYRLLRQRSHYTRESTRLHELAESAGTEGTIGFYKVGSRGDNATSIMEELMWKMAGVMHVQGQFAATKRVPSPLERHEGSLQTPLQGQLLHEYMFNSQYGGKTLTLASMLKAAMTTIAFGMRDAHSKNIFVSEDDHGSLHLNFFDNAWSMPPTNGILYRGMTEFKSSYRVPGIFQMMDPYRPLRKEDYEVLKTELLHYKKYLPDLRNYLQDDETKKLVAQLPPGWFDPEKALEAMEERLDKVEQFIKMHEIDNPPRAGLRELIFEINPELKFILALCFASDFEGMFSNVPFLQEAVEKGTRLTDAQLIYLQTRFLPIFPNINVFMELCINQSISPSQIYMWSMHHSLKNLSFEDIMRNIIHLKAEVAKKNGTELLQLKQDAINEAKSILASYYKTKAIDLKERDRKTAAEVLLVESFCDYFGVSQFGFSEYYSSAVWSADSTPGKPPFRVVKLKESLKLICNVMDEAGEIQLKMFELDYLSEPGKFKAAEFRNQPITFQKLIDKIYPPEQREAFQKAYEAFKAGPKREKYLSMNEEELKKYLDPNWNAAKVHLKQAGIQVAATREEAQNLFANSNSAGSVIVEPTGRIGTPDQDPKTITDKIEPEIIDGKFTGKFKFTQTLTANEIAEFIKAKTDRIGSRRLQTLQTRTERNM